VLVGNIFDQRSFLSAPVVEAGQDRTRPNLKIQDGCNNRCTFCVIPSVRGNSRSAGAASVIAQIRQLAATHKEVVLTGINLGRWGRDLDGRPRLPWLLRRILAETDIARLRLSSVEPMDWTSELLELVASSDRLAKHMHIPLQSGCDRTLKAMRRRYRARHYEERLRLARALMPHAAIGADVMAGFPGETGEDFEESRRFIAAMPFTYLHLFTYSARPGTPAAESGEQIEERVRKERNRVLRELAAKKNLEFRRSLVGQVFDAVTLERADALGRAALTGNYVSVAVEGQGIPAGKLVRVKITEASADLTLARIAS
jgi:threonylcarbamoyladenosine tRNA methylthiotransferase MtaB